MLARLNLVMHGWANYFRHAVAKNIFSMLDNFTWWRMIRCCGCGITGDGTRSADDSPPPPAGGNRSRQTGRVATGSRRSRSAGTATGATRSPHPGFNHRLTTATVESPLR